jgi:hypothetical protein
VPRREPGSRRKDRRATSGRSEAAPRVTPNVGLEIELTQSDRKQGMALTAHENKLWKKRDVIHPADAWDVTLDDTPEDDERRSRR